MNAQPKTPPTVDMSCRPNAGRLAAEAERDRLIANFRAIERAERLAEIKLERRRQDAIESQKIADDASAEFQEAHRIFARANREAIRARAALADRAESSK